jgi:hypothetical protein
MTVYIIGLVKRLYSFSNLVKHMTILKDIVKSDFENIDEQAELMLETVYH